MRCVAGIPLCAEAVAELFGQRLDGGFAGVVRRVAWRVGDALFAARQDDGRRARRLLNHGEKSAQAVDDAEEVGPQCFLEVGYVLPRLAGGGFNGRPRVEEQEVDGAVVGWEACREVVADCEPCVVVRHVERVGLDFAAG